MKKITAIIIFIIGLFFIPGWNTTPVEVCFATKKISYNSLKKIMTFPFAAIGALFYSSENKWKIPAYCSIFQLILHILQNDPINGYSKITIIEGMTASEIEKLINNHHDLAKAHVKIAEGELFPDTYHFRKGDSRAKIVSMAKQNMRKKLNKLYKKHNSKIDKRKLIILASIVQKECAESEMIAVASCFINRLRKKIHLCSNSTLLYGLNKRGITWLLISETKIKNEYNTYLNYGLPPGPICSPGFAALESVMIAYAKPLDYIYFCHKGDTIFLSKTLQEHAIKKHRARKKKHLVR